MASPGARDPMLDIEDYRSSREVQMIGDLTYEVMACLADRPDMAPPPYDECMASTSDLAINPPEEPISRLDLSQEHIHAAETHVVASIHIPVVPAPDISAPPPAYDSLFGRVKAAKRQSTGCVDFVKAFFVIIFGTIGLTVLVGIFLAIPFAMVALGSYHLQNCRANEYIPIYLIVMGCVLAARLVIYICQEMFPNDQNSGDKNSGYMVNSFTIFLFGWFIAGNVFIYSLYPSRSDDPSSAHYCHPVLYQFAFWVTTSTYILIGTTYCCVCCGETIMTLQKDDESL